MSSDDVAAGAASQELPAVEADSRGRRRELVTAFLLALAGAAMTWAAMEYIPPVFTVPKEYEVPGLGAPPEKLEALRVVQGRVDRGNAMLNLGWFGALLAGMLALGEGIARRSPKPMLIAIPVGAAGGCVAGLAGGLVYGGPLGDLTETVKLQVVMLGGLGSSVGLALGIPRRSLHKILLAAIAGMAGGVLAGILYPVGISLLLPTASTDTLIPSGTASRLLWLGISSAALGLFIAGLSHKNDRGRN